MATKIVISFTVLAFYVSSSVFYSPALGFPTSPEMKGYSIGSLSKDVNCSSFKDGENNFKSE